MDCASEEMTVAASAAAAISSVLVLILCVCLVLVVTVCAPNITDVHARVNFFLFFLNNFTGRHFNGQHIMKRQCLQWFDGMSRGDGIRK